LFTFKTHYDNSIQFNLFTRKFNSPEANYKASTSREEKRHIQTKYKNKAIIIIIIIIPLTQIKVQSKIYTFINNKKNINNLKCNSLFLSLNTTAMGANCRTSTIKKGEGCNTDT
jgi:hypothetical protein